MADLTLIGTDWRDDELDLILADHFAMLAQDLAGRPYVKAHHAAALMALTGRTHRSVEFKHMNISAVLAELGLPTIAGYKPKPNYQRAIIAAVDRYLTARPAALVLHREAGEGDPEGVEGANRPAIDWNPGAPPGLAEPMALFEEPPPEPGSAPWARQPDMARLVRKFDPAARDARNRALGLAGERLVLAHERRRLTDAARPDLARRIRWVSQEDGDGAGYDIASFDPSGQERLIEVKATAGARTTPFLITRNEHALSTERPDAFRLRRIYALGAAPRLFTLKPPLAEAVTLTAELLRAGFEGR